MSATDPKRQLTTVRLQNIAQSYGQSAALMAAVELDIFTAISNGAGTFDEVANAVDIVPTNAERLIVLLCAAGTIEVDADRLKNAEDTERFLVKGKPGYMGEWITFTKPQWNEWGRLSDHLRVKDLKDLGSIGDLTVEEARRYHQSTLSIGLGAGRRFVRHVDLSKRNKIMDIGGGSGGYCISAVNTHAHIEAVILDLPPVCVVAREILEQHGVTDRVTATPCDFTNDPFPADCDVAIMASNLPMYSRDIIKAVIAKAHDALLPGGEMHLIGEMTNNDRTGPWGPAYWGLGQAISNSKGLAHSEADVRGYFEAAGFERIEYLDFIPGSLDRMVGYKA